MSDIQRLADIIRTSDHIVFFGGAGVSTESGIPDFRGNSGLYRVSDGAEVPPEIILHRNFFRRNPEQFYDYYRNHMLYPDARPNAAHEALAELERMGKLTAVITQNIDGLHQRAGSKNVIELHGSTLRNHCVTCGRPYDLDTVMSSEGVVPHCPACGGIIRPDVVLYGEPLDDRMFTLAEAEVAAADVLIVGGTSLTVHPAAGLLYHYVGHRLVIINQTPTPFDDRAELVIRHPIGKTFATVMNRSIT